MPSTLYVKFAPKGAATTIVPVGTAQVGWVTVPAVGAVGAPGTALTTAFKEADEVQPVDISVTVKLYVAGFNAAMVVVVPDPAIAPGLIVQAPAGKPLNATVPVGEVQVGCVIVPIIGAIGAVGTALTTTFKEADEVQPVVVSVTV